MTILFLF